MKVHYSGQRVMEIPVQFKERRHGKSKLNLKKEAPKFFMKLLWYTVLFRVLKKS
jgi:hypothetical protein